MLSVMLCFSCLCQSFGVIDAADEVEVQKCHQRSRWALALHRDDSAMLEKRGRPLKT